MTHFTSKLFLLVFVLFLCQNLMAAATSMNENVPDSAIQSYSIQEVEILGNHRETEIIPPKKLEGDILQGLSCQSVADAVRYFSGVQIKDYGGVGGIKTINIRVDKH